MNKVFLSIFLSCIITLYSCKDDTKRFTLLSAEDTGIDFVNQIKESDTLNALNFSYLYHGAGVGVIDANNDGLQDLYFSGNMNTGKLYLNRGNIKFEDVTAQSNLQTQSWVNGVAIVDINQDGLQDIYLNVSHWNDNSKASNQLFVNNGLNEQGIPVYTEQAKNYGLDDTGYSMQSAFFDYDNDGDLDVYILTNGQDNNKNNNTPHARKLAGENINTDRLYRNEGKSPSGHPVFTDVSDSAGILTEGYGLGVALLDVNDDGWMDIYIANDFLSNDILWVNNGDGTFNNKIAQYIKHQSYNGMGVDIADINNDGSEDIMVMDMLPERNSRKKMMFSGSNYNKFKLALGFGYEPQYVRNTLQLSRGEIKGEGVQFSEIGQLAGVHQTDWSWAALFADFDNDGHKDLFVTNGYRRDVTDLDFIVYDYNSFMFGTEEFKQKSITTRFNTLPEVKLDNYIFKNSGKLTFEDVSEEWGIKIPSFSNGAAYADLDNDGDLDLVVNNIDEPAFIYRNNTNALQTGKNNPYHFINIQLEGAGNNKQGIGAKIRIKHENTQQYYEHSRVRGYLSTVQQIIHFGLGKSGLVDSIEIIWPDGNYQLLTNIPSDTLIIIDYRNKSKSRSQLPIFAFRKSTSSPLFKEVSDSLNINFVHKEADFNDFERQILVPHKYSQDGPGIAVGDINGDGLEDFFIGGAKGFNATLYFQQPTGSFLAEEFLQGKSHEDLGALLFDADADGDNDLYVVSGSNEFARQSKWYQDRLYANDGKGNFTYEPDALPEMYSNSSCVRAADFDQDGDLDLFLGGSMEPGNYPFPERSYLLQNDKGRFTDVTLDKANELKNIGLVKDALWSDFNNDGLLDLILVGEWMAPTFFENKAGKLTNVTHDSGVAAAKGWWNSITGGDFDKDGDIDYVVGNLGLNSQYKVNENQTMRLLVKDFDENGINDPILTYFIKNEWGELEPFAAPFRNQLIDQVPAMKKVFGRYVTYSQAKLEDVTFPEIPIKRQDDAIIMSSSYFENDGKGKFTIHELPLEAQMSPIYGIVTHDFNGDGILDVIATGNSYAPEVQNGRYDAGVGLVLLGDGAGNFSSISTSESGFYVDGDAKSLAKIKLGNKIIVLAASNQDELKVFQSKIHSPLNFIALKSTDSKAEIFFKNGKKEVREFYYGSGYLSQSSRTLIVPRADIDKVILYDYRGNSREVEVD